MLRPGVFASRFPTSKGTVWTIVNRNEYDVAGAEIEIPNQGGMHFYDLWHGTELTPTIVNGKARLSFELEGLGYGAVLATDQKPDDSVEKLLVHGGAFEASARQLLP